ncbi:MAG: ATP synthase subunit I [Aestuariivirga sp.]
MDSLELDAKQMSTEILHRSSMLFPFAAYFFGGAGIGVCYFLMLRRSVELMFTVNSTGKAVLLTFARLVVIGSSLALVSTQGKIPLLAMALGILIGRQWVMLQKEASAP